MILNNYWSFAAYVGTHNMTWMKYTDSVSGAKNTSGDTVTMIAGPNQNSGEWVEKASEDYALRKNLGAIVGAGTTEPTADDYALANDITNSISNFSCSVSTANDGGKLSTVVTITGVNNTANSITISEIGIYKNYYADSGFNFERCLFIRHILDTPKTVASGSGFSLTFEWTEQ